MLTIIPGVVVRRVILVKELGWLDGKRAQTRHNFPANRDYADLRGLTLTHLDAALAEERSGYALLEAEALHKPSSTSWIESGKRLLLCQCLILGSRPRWWRSQCLDACR
jgi:hypothetical protein